VLNEYFSSVFTLDDNKFPEINYKLPTILETCIFSDSIVLNAIRKLRPKLSAGPDGYPSFFLKNVAFYICKPLSIIFEISYRTHSLPNEWLQSNVVPIHKKGPKNKVQNYRPISLTSVCCKIMETIVKGKVMSYLETNNILSSCQYGFRSYHSTVSQLLFCTDEWTKKIDSKKNVDVIYFDFAKAFDTVCHNKLIQKLSAIGISGNLLLWIQSFLSNRTQKILVNGFKSNISEVKSGVPQGSVLGPLLFLIYINDLPSLLNDVTCVMFADDLKIFHTVDNKEQVCKLQNAINTINIWAKTWQLQLSPSKCIVLHLGKTNPAASYFIENQAINEESECRDLGVMIDSDLKFTKHIKNIVKIAYFKINQLFKVFRSKNRQNLLLAYITYIRPTLEYASSIWSPYLLKDIHVIERVQKFFTRRLLKKLNLNYTERLTQLNLESLETRRIKADLLETYKHVNNIGNRKLETFFKLSKNPYKANSMNLYIEYSRLDLRKHWFSSRIAPIWNSLPENVKKLKSETTFKHELEKIDLRKYCRGPT
jgi:hypothetical protein